MVAMVEREALLEVDSLLEPQQLLELEVPVERVERHTEED